VSDAGIHNDNLAQYTSQYIESGSWKRQRVICILPAGKSVPTRVALAWRSLIFPPNQAAHFIATEGAEVGQAYSDAIAGILAHPELSQWEYLLCVEHDNLPAPDGLIKLIRQMEKHPEYSAIGGLYFTKGEGGVPQIWGDPNDPVTNFRPQPPKAGELVECCGTGQGFTLFRLSMFKDEKIARPWFRTKCSLEEGVGTQDLAFWSEARKHGHRCAIDCAVPVGHLDSSTNVVW
jgi:hypothetical protein